MATADTAGTAGAAAQSAGSYTIDIVLCIDCTASMGDVIDRVKAVALSFDEQVAARLATRRITIDALRVRVVGFRDLADHGPRGLEPSKFFTLPGERRDFERFVKRLKLMAGNTLPESGLVGLAASIGSDWTRAGAKRRHVVVVWTDEPPHRLEDEPLGGFPDMPRDFDQLSDRWMANQGALTTGSQRLILFTPGAGAWTEIAEHWDNVVHLPSRIT
jgi:hypothetical protein